jgi:hypothetical protein
MLTRSRIPVWLTFSQAETMRTLCPIGTAIRPGGGYRVRKELPSEMPLA